MPELTGEVTSLSISVSLGAAAAGIMVFCLGLTIAARRFAPATVCLAAGAVVGALVLLGYQQLYGDPLVTQELAPMVAVHFLLAAIGVPSAVAAWLAIRRASRPLRSPLFVDALVAAAGFAAVLPIAMVVASLPG